MSNDIDNILNPPLRLVLNTNCLGKCYFCHKEGYSSSATEYMSMDLIRESCSAARELNLKRIALTGGEPTMRDDLIDIVKTIKTELPDCRLGITSNGYRILPLLNEANSLIDKLNISMSTLNPQLNKDFTGVDSRNILIEARHYIGVDITVNLMVIKQNIDEIPSYIDYCLELGYRVDLLFDLIENDIAFQRQVIAKMVEKYGLFDIDYSSTPVMSKCRNSDNRIRIKCSKISRILRRPVCATCPYDNECSERICAVRVFPNGEVSACLNQYLTSDRSSVTQRIIDVYNKIQMDYTTIYDFLV